jgi:glutaredoxin
MASRSAITVYVRAGDPRCIATVKTLKAGGVPFAVVDVDHPQVVVPPLRQIRMGLLPVVTVGEAVWGGHLPGTLALLVSMRGAGSPVEAPRPASGDESTGGER